MFTFNFTLKIIPMRSFSLFLCCCFCILSLSAQTEKKDHFHVPAPIKFNSGQYYLSDSYHPETYYYKQEYLPKGEHADKFNTMVTIDVLIGNLTVKDAIMQKISEIEAMKKSDPVARYETFEHPESGEYMLDFMLSQSEGEMATLVEWNVYRYTTYTDKAGQKGVLLFAYTRRGYGDGIKSFFENLKANRMTMINMLGAYKLPVIQVSK